MDEKTPEQERADAIAAIAAALDAFPDIGPRKGRRIGIHTKLKIPFATELYDKGLRLHPELATVFPIPGRKHGAMAYLDVPDWVDAKKYAEYLAANPGARAAALKAAPGLEQMRQMLAIANPELAARLPTMSAEELAEANVEYAERVPLPLQRLANLTNREHRMRAQELRRFEERNTKGGESQ